MRLYFVPEVLAKGPDGIEALRPDFGGLAIGGAFTHLRNGFLCTLPNRAPHAELIALPGVTFLPFVDDAGRPLGLNDTIGAIPLAQRAALRTRLEARGVPLDGIGLSSRVELLLRRIHRRAALRQMLVDAGLQDFASLDTTDLPGQRLEALRARRLDVDGLVETKPRELLARLLPRIGGIRVRPWTGALRGGTFTDDFNGEGSNVDLTAHTPSGGTAWTRLSGSSGDIVVDSANGWMALRTTFFGANAVYLCDDQGDANQYVEFENRNTPDIFYFIANRITNGSNYIGVRNIATNGLDLQKRVAGSFTQLGSDSIISAGDIVRMECDGNNIEVFVNGVSAIGPVTETFNNTETRQGVFGDGNTNANLLDDYEAGILTAGGGEVDLAGEGNAVSGSAAGLTVSREMAGAIAASTAAAGALRVARQVQGAGGASSAAGNAALTVRRGLTGALAALSAAAAALRVGRGLAGGASASSAGSAVLRVLRSLVGAGDASSAATAAVRVVRRLAGAIGSSAAASATLRVGRALAGLGSAICSAVGSLFDGSVAGPGTVTLNARRVNGLVLGARRSASVGLSARAAATVTLKARPL